MDRPHHTWITYLARAGYASRGVVYAIIGLFAILAAIGSSSNKDTEGALSALLEQPFGVALVWLMMIGLIGYVIWRLVQSLFDTDDHGWSAKGMAVRAGLLASAFTYSTLALYSAFLLGLFSSGGSGSSGGGGEAVSDFIAGFVGSHYVSLGLACVFLGVACAHWWKVFTGKYADHFKCDEDEMAFVHGVSMTGLTARGIVFAIVALLLFYRFLNRNGDGGETPGIKDVMRFIQDMPMGNWLMAAMGIGILAFSAYSIAEARWRKINVEDA